MYPALKRATIAQLVITKATRAYRIALAAFPGSTKTKTARLNVNIALKTQQQPIATVPLHVTFVVGARQHQMEVWFVRNVWPGNLKKPQAPTNKVVPLACRGITRTSQTRQTRANNAHVGTLNLRLGKRRAYHAAPANLPMSLVL